MSLRDVFDDDLAEASITTLIFVMLDSFLTGYIGREICCTGLS